jgi:hypothetical protein
LLRLIRWIGGSSDSPVFQFTGKPSTDKSFDENIYALADHCATQYIDSHIDTDDTDTRMRVLFLKHLLWVVRNINPRKYILSGEIIKVLSDLSDSKVRRDYLYRKIIAPLRDAGVTIASCSQGYKIPTCIDDIYAYVNQTNGIVGPMLNRVEKCSNLFFLKLTVLLIFLTILP